MALPSWLQPADVAGEYARGLQIGNSIASERNRLAAENQRTQMEYQARQETQKQEALRSNAILQQSKARSDAELGLQQARLDEVQKMNAIKTQDAARKLATQTQFNNLLKAGVPVEKAIYMSGAGGPSQVIGAQKIGQQEQNLALRTRAENRLEGEAATKANKPVPDLKGTYKVPDDQGGGLVTGPLGALQQRFGTNLPPVMQDPWAQYQSIADVRAAAKRKKNPLPRDEAIKIINGKFKHQLPPDQTAATTEE